MTKALAKEFGGRGICVNAVCPGKIHRKNIVIAYYYYSMQYSIEIIVHAEYCDVFALQLRDIFAEINVEVDY